MRKQGGAALVVSLIILAVLTVIGVASMQNTGLELKMISSAHDRSIAFEAVETALTIIEQSLADSPPTFTQLSSGCTGIGCFNKSCDGGLCFAGNYSVDGERSQCYLANGADETRRDFWEDQTLNVWSDTKKHKSLTVTGLKTPVKYIVEFLCFINVGSELNVGFSTQGASSEVSENENYKPLYRITATANGNANRATVILQSTYRIANET